MGGICRAVHIYAKANNKYTDDYDPSIGSSYFMYWDINNLYGWAMSQKSQWMDFDRMRRNLNSHKKIFITMMLIVKNDMSLRLMFVIPSV